MGKQPYIPFYIGDYLKDTRVLPLEVRGAWVDLILFMWDNPVRGELVGSIEEFARLMSCTPTEAESALQLLMKKKTADITLADGVWTIVSRRMKADAALSKTRSDTANERWNKEEKKLKTKSIGRDVEPAPEGLMEFDEATIRGMFGDIVMEGYSMAFKGVDLNSELDQFIMKVRNDWSRYRARDSGGMRNAFQLQLRGARERKTKDNSKQSKTSFMDQAKQIHGQQ